MAWLFDESESMRDDQQAVLAKFNKITDDLGARVDQMSEKRSEVEAGSDVAETDPKKRTDRRRPGPRRIRCVMP